MVFVGLVPGTRVKTESMRLMWIDSVAFKRSAAYSPMKQSFGMSEPANKPNPVPEAVVDPLTPRHKGGK
jgi:hypothetical protein